MNAYRKLLAKLVDDAEGSVKRERRSRRRGLAENARRTAERRHERDEGRDIDIVVLQSRLECSERSMNNLDALLEVVRGD